MVALMDMVQLCGQVGALIKPEKVIGPTTSLPLLGILLDTINQVANSQMTNLQPCYLNLNHWPHSNTPAQKEPYYL